MTGHLRTVPDEELAAYALFLQRGKRDFERSPVADMAKWIASGELPSGRQLRVGLNRWDTRSLVDDGLYDPHQARRAYVARFGFSIPCAEAVAAVVALGPVLEIGAGSAYWSALFAKAGADVLATDAEPAGKINPYGFPTGFYHPTIRLTAVRAVKLHGAGRTVFSSWPCYKDSWCEQAVSLIPAGGHFVMVGESRGGCTGTDGLFDLLDRDFDKGLSVAIPQWPTSNDYLTVYRRRRA